MHDANTSPQVGQYRIREEHMVQPDCDIISIEEHFMFKGLTDHFPPAVRKQPAHILDKLYTLAEDRLRVMDDAGIRMQVLSHQSPSSQRLNPDDAVEICQQTNDFLFQSIQDHPTRFSGFATLPTTAGGQAAADELRRAVEELGMKGGMIHGPSSGEFLDADKFRPLFAQAQALGVPIYLHPAKPDAEVSKRYYAPYDDTHPAILQAAWGFGIETGTQGVRMILSGIFDELPDLQIILGHLGEAIPFWLDRADQGFARPNNRPSRFAEVFRSNFHVTTSGFFSDRALDCTLDAIGLDRVMFAVDHPYADDTTGVQWIQAHPMPQADKQAIFSGNAKRLLRI